MELGKATYQVALSPKTEVIFADTKVQASTQDLKVGLEVIVYYRGSGTTQGDKFVASKVEIWGGN